MPSDCQNLINFLRNIKSLLDVPNAPVDGLVLAYCASSNEAYNLVYLTKPPQQITITGWEIFLLDELHEPVIEASLPIMAVGYSSLGKIFSWLPFAGENFYPIEKLLGELKQRPNYFQTAFKLAQWITNKVKENNPPITKDILRLAVPHLIQQAGVKQPVAVLIEHNSQNLLAFDNPPVRVFSTQADDMEQLAQLSPDPSDWLIGMAELKECNPRLTQGNLNWLDLRTTLRPAEPWLDWRPALCSLAKLILQKDENNRDYLHLAYALAVEFWLGKMDILDVVALLPHKDIHTFIETGDVLPIYRQNRYSTKPALTLDDWVAGEGRNCDQYHQVAVTIQALEPQFVTLELPIIDLESTLEKAGMITPAIRLLWMASRDFLDPPSPGWENAPANINTAIMLIRRAVLLSCLTNPGEWRQGQRSLMIHQIYNHLEKCLVYQRHRATDKTLIGYYRALQEWHNCAHSSDIIRSLGAVYQAAQEFQKGSNPIEYEPQRRFLSHLSELCRGLVRFEMRVNRKAIGLDQQGGILDQGYPLEPPYPPNDAKPLSPFFYLYFSKYLDLHNNWDALRQSFNNVQPERERLQKLSQNYKYLLQQTFAPAHELAIVRWAIQQDLQLLENLLKIGEAELAPDLQYELKTPHVIAGCSERIYLELLNRGSLSAYRIEINLELNQQFQLKSDSSTIQLESLFPASRQRISWDIEAIEGPFQLIIHTHFIDSHNKEYQLPTKVFPIQSLSPNTAVVRQMPDYRVGKPVHGENFFGRTKELHWVLDLLKRESAEAILLHGPRRIGKSSILRQLDWLLHSPGRLQRFGYSLEEEAGFRSKKCVFISLEAVYKQHPKYAQEWFLTIHKEACKVFGEPPPEQSIVQDFYSNPAIALTTHMNDLLARYPGQGLVILLDEFDYIYRLDYKELDSNLRNVLTASNNKANWIISSTWYKVDEPQQKKGSPLFRSAPSREIKEMDWSDAVRLVSEPAERVGLLWQGDAIYTILKLTGLRPYLIQLLCLRCADQKTNPITPASVRKVITQLINEPVSTAQNVGFLIGARGGRVEERLSGIGQLILLIINSHPQGLSRSEIKDLIDDFLQHNKLSYLDPDFITLKFTQVIEQLILIYDILNEDEGSGAITFSYPLIEQWLKQQITRQENLEQLACQLLLQEWEKWSESLENKR